MSPSKYIVTGIITLIICAVVLTTTEQRISPSMAWKIGVVIFILVLVAITLIEFIVEKVASITKSIKERIAIHSLIKKVEKRKEKLKKHKIDYAFHLKLAREAGDKWYEEYKRHLSTEENPLPFGEFQRQKYGGEKVRVRLDY